MRSNSDENSTNNSQKNTRLIIDANILFAALIKNNKTSELIFSKKLELYAPKFLFEEFEKYKTILLDKTKRSEQTFTTITKTLKKRITIINEATIKKHLEEARNISPDPNDAAYFAAAIAKKARIWSNDKQLKKQQETINIITTEELIKTTNKNGERQNTTNSMQNTDGQNADRQVPEHHPTT